MRTTATGNRDMAGKDSNVDLEAQSARRACFRGGLRSHVAHGRLRMRAGEARLLPRTKLDNAGNASPGDVSPTVEECWLRTGHADLTPSDAFPGTEKVALLAMVRLRKPASAARVTSRGCAQCTARLNRECRFREQEARHGKRVRQRLWFDCHALGPGLVLAEGVGSAFCPLAPSRRLRLFAPPALPTAQHARSAETAHSTAKQGC